MTGILIYKQSMEYISIRESNPICPALVKLSPFRIVGLARRQPCCTLTHQKNEIFPACRVEEFPQSKFFVRQGKSADHPDGLTSILTQDCGKFACGNHIVFDSLMLTHDSAQLHMFNKGLPRHSTRTRALHSSAAISGRMHSR